MIHNILKFQKILFKILKFQKCRKRDFRDLVFEIFNNYILLTIFKFIL
jgi:hypothetical protein